jgi:hypothetical protein
VYDNFLFLDRGNMMQASEAFVQHGFGKIGGSVLRMTDLLNLNLVLRLKFCG